MIRGIYVSLLVTSSRVIQGIRFGLLCVGVGTIRIRISPGILRSLKKSVSGIRFTCGLCKVTSICYTEFIRRVHNGKE